MSAVMSSLKPLVAAALIVGTGAANAALTVYTDAASFAAAIATMGGVSGTDSFDDLAAGANLGAGPLARSAGSLGYIASVGPTSDVFYGAGNGTDNWLSTNNATDTVLFAGFSAGTYAFGGNVFGSNINGDFLRRGVVTLTATDGDEIKAVSIRRAQLTSFIGFISDDGGLYSVTLNTTVRGNNPVWPTINNLTLAAAVPEPETYALMLAGLAAVTFLARRRKAD